MLNNSCITKYCVNKIIIKKINLFLAQIQLFVIFFRLVGVLTGLSKPKQETPEASAVRRRSRNAKADFSENKFQE